MSKKIGRIITRQERKEFIENGLDECLCDGAGHCPIFMLAMSENLHHRCKTSQFHRNYFLRQAKRDEEESPTYHNDFTKKSQLREAVSKVENAILALEHEGVKPEDAGSEGFGDTVSKVLQTFGITERLMSAVGADSSCKCSKRRKWLNKMLPYGVEKDD